MRGVSDVCDGAGSRANPDIAAALAEFPEYDGRAASIQRTGLIARRASALLAEAPDSLDTADALIQASRWRDALAVIRRAVAGRSADLSRACELLVQGAAEFRAATSEDGTALREFADAARVQIRTLPREQARERNLPIDCAGRLPESRRRSPVVGAFQRTKARAKVTIGYSGCDVLLEKVDGAWKATGLANQWVT